MFNTIHYTIQKKKKKKKSKKVHDLLDKVRNVLGLQV